LPARNTLVQLLVLHTDSESLLDRQTDGRHDDDQPIILCARLKTEPWKFPRLE